MDTSQIALLGPEKPRLPQSSARVDAGAKDGLRHSAFASTYDGSGKRSDEAAPLKGENGKAPDTIRQPTPDARQMPEDGQTVDMSGPAKEQTSLSGTDVPASAQSVDPLLAGAAQQGAESDRSEPPSGSPDMAMIIAESLLTKRDETTKVRLSNAIIDGPAARNDTNTTKDTTRVATSAPLGTQLSKDDLLLGKLGSLGEKTTSNGDQTPQINQGQRNAVLQKTAPGQGITQTEDNSGGGPSKKIIPGEEALLRTTPPVRTESTSAQTALSRLGLQANTNAIHPPPRTPQDKEFLRQEKPKNEKTAAPPSFQSASMNQQSMPSKPFEISPPASRTNAASEMGEVKAHSETVKAAHTVNVTSYANTVATAPLISNVVEASAKPMIDDTLLPVSAEVSATGALQADQARPTASMPIINRPEIGHAVASQIADVVRLGGDGKLEVMLKPEELGRMSLTFSNDGRAMHVTLAADRPETLDLVRRNIDVLENELRDMGFETLTFDFSDAQGDTSDEDARDTPQAPELNDSNKDSLSGPQKPDSRSNRRASSGGMDLRF